MVDRATAPATSATTPAAPSRGQVRPPQSYANHRRFHPLVHFVVSPLLAANLVVALVALGREPSGTRAWAAVMALALLLLHVAARVQALTVQNRVIRLEMSLRLGQVLPAQLAGRARELPLGQVLALRFASDRELPTLVRRVLAGELPTPDATKRAIRDWQADYLRA
ncbi:MAG TPA: DUF6526 family protein [Gemmatirosa sp.]|nr:DUF6526 family protein [Gemmatirosa sp.]